MATCSHLAPNGEKSLLYQQAATKYGPDIANDIWTAVRTQQFLNEYNNWEDLTLDVNGEPTLEFVESVLPIVTTLAPKFKGQMTFEYGANRRPDIDAISTIQAIRMGERTATTRYEADGHIDYWKDAKVGDIIEFSGKNDEKVLVEVTKPLHRISNITAEEWSKKEGWSIEYFNKKVKPKLSSAWQIEYKLYQTSIPAIIKQQIIENVNLETDKIQTEDSILERVQELYNKAIANPNTIYKIDYQIQGAKRKYKSGFTAREMAGFFDRFAIPENVVFDPGFRKLIENSAGRIKKEMFNDNPIELIQREREIINDNMLKILTPKINSNGTLVGYFTPLQHQEVVDSIKFFVQRLLAKDPNQGANALISAISMMYNKSLRLTQLDQNPEQAENLMFVYQQRERFVAATLKELEGLGLRMNEKATISIIQAVRNLNPLSEAEKREIEETVAETITEELDVETGEFIEIASRGLKDWTDITFELNPKDTASSRIKMFIATLPEMDTAVYQGKKDDATVQLNPEEIVIGDTTLDKLLKLEGVDQAFDTWRSRDLGGLQKIVTSINRKTFWLKNQKTTDAFAVFARENFPLIPKENFLNMMKLVDYDSTFQEILELLADTDQSLDGYKNALRNSDKPNLIYLGNQLDLRDKSFQNEFAKVMSKQYQEFTMILFNRTAVEGKESFTLNPINANRYNQKNSIIKNWQNLQKVSEIVIKNQSNDRVMDVTRIRGEWLPVLQKAQSINLWEGKDTDWIKIELGKIFNLSGIQLDENMMNYLIDNIDKLTKKKFPGGLSRQFSITKEGKPNGMFSAFIMKAAGMTEESDIDQSIEESISKAELHNPLYTENSTMQILATVAARFTPVLHSSNHRSSEGKNVWDYGLNTKLSHKFRNFIEDFDNQYETLQKVDIAKDSWLLRYIKETPAILQNMKISYLDGIKPTWGKRGTTRPSMSDREQLLTAVALFQNRGNGFNRISRVNYISLTHSDKTTTPVFMNMPKVNTGKAGAIPSTVIGGLDSHMYNIFKSEYSRIQNQKDIIFNDDKYDKGKGLFYFIPDFNYDSMKDLINQGLLTQAEFELIWVNGKRNLTTIINSDKELRVINKVLANFTRNLINNTTATWFENNIVSATENSFDQKYVTKLLSDNGYSAIKGLGGVVVYKDQSNGIHSSDAVNKVIIGAAAQDFAINYFLFNTALSQIFYGDPAQTYKGKKGMIDAVAVDLTMKEYAKRLAKDIAPGQDPYWNPNEMKYTTITLADVKPAEKYLSNYEALAKAYREVEGTDAQEVTTVDEHLDVMMALGLVQESVYNEMKTIVREAGPGNYYEFTLPEHLAIIFQPMKPVYSHKREPFNGAQLEDYIKSSSYPLYPPMTVGTEMDGLRRMMEGNNPSNTVIKRANFESAKKIGLPTAPLIAFSKDGKFQIPDSATLNAAIQVLDRGGFRIQQEVPYDEEKEAIKTVSQMNKLITEGIANLNEFQIGGQTMDGRQVRAYKEEIRKSMVALNLNKFLKEFTVDRNSTRTRDFSIKDFNQVYDLLATEAQKKGYTINELQSLLIRNDDGELAIPLMFNSAADRLESMLMSLVKKISDIKMPGKSFVQASSVGFTFTRESNLDRSQVVWAESYDGTALKTLRNEDGTIKAAQVLLPFNFFGSDGQRLNIEDFTKIVDGKKIIDTEKIDPKLLQHIGARIPNQGHNSMLPIEVVGFIPGNMGDLVIVPSAITKQMGADFDVDKLYTYKRNYAVVDGKLNTSSSEEDSMEILQDQYFDVHWGVLTHPEMLEKILRPLDKDDLKVENKKLASNAITNYYDVVNQLKDFQSGKEAKLLVGSTSLSVTFNSVIQNKDLRLYELVESIGPNGNPILIESYVTIPVLDEVTGKVLELTRLSGTGTSYYTEVDGAEPRPEDYRTKHDNHTTTQSAAVDNAKERALDNLNLTRNTYRAASAFIQLETSNEEAVNLKYITRLLTQPIIKEFDRRMKVGNDSLSEEFTKDLRLKIFQDLRTEYTALLPEGGEVKDILFSPQLLLSMQSMREDSSEYAEHQLAALELFIKLDDVGKRLSELKSLFNQDTNGAGQNILASLDKEAKLVNINQVPIMGADAIFENINTEQGYIFDRTVGVANKVLTQLLPYDKLTITNSNDETTDIFSIVAGMGNKVSLTIDQKREIIRSFRSFTFSSGEHWWNDAQQERSRLFYGREGIEQSLAQRLIDAKRTWGKDNYFLQRLDARIGNTTDSPDYVEYQASSIGRIDEENNNRGWLTILISENPQERMFGEDLIRYAYLTGGIQDATSFVKYVPVSYIANTDFGVMLRKVQRELIAPDNNGMFAVAPVFLMQYFQHNPEMTAQISKSTLDKITEYTTGTTSDLDYPEIFRMPDVRDPLFNAAALGNFAISVTPQLEMVPYISYRSKAEGKWILYSKMDKEGSIYYTRIDTLGNSNSDEYNGDTTGAIRSIFTENRSLAMEIPKPDGIDEIGNLTNNMFGKFYEGTSSYDEIGVKAGGIEAIDAALGSIQSNTRIPQYMRVFATVLKTTQSKFNSTANNIFTVTEFKPEIRFNSNLNALGQASNKGVIELNPDIALTQKQSAETFLHELAHLRVQNIVAALGYDPRVHTLLNDPGFDPERRKFILDQMQNFAKNNPELGKSVDALDRIRYEAYNALANQLGGEETFNRILDEILLGNLSTPQHEIVYALSSTQELIAHVMTNDKVANFLNTLTSSRNQTFLERMWDAITDIFENMAKAFGFEIKSNSLLREAIMHTLNLTNDTVRKDTDTTSAILTSKTLQTDSQQEAENIKSIVESVYKRKTDVSSNMMGYSISITDKKLGGTQISRLIGKLTSQLRNTEYEISRSKDPKGKVAAQIRYRELREQINTLKTKPDLNLVVNIGKKQMEWVDQVLNNPNAKAVDVQSAIVITNTWEGLIDLMYGNLSEISSINPGFADLQTEANTRRIQLFNKKANKVVIEALQNRVQLVSADFNKDVTEINKAEADWLTLGRVKSKLAQGIAVLGRSSANSRDTEIAQMAKRLEGIEKRMKARGFNSELFIQDDEWGLVQKLSKKWFQFNTELKKTRDIAIDNSDNLPITETERTEKKAIAWERYWQDFTRGAVFVDTRIFFDFEDGKKIDTDQSRTALDKLAKEVGSVEYAKELVEQAYTLYQSYLEEREVAKQYFETDLILTTEESEGLSSEDQDELLKKKQSAALNKWLYYNSPAEFLNKVENPKRGRYNSAGDRWLISAPKISRKEFFDAKYQTIQENKDLQKIYEDFRTLVQEMVNYLPATERAKISPDFLPIVSTETMNTLAGAIGKVRNMDATIMNALTATEGEELSRVKADEIPIRYLRHTKRSEESQSKDIFRVTELFSMMALHYKHMSSVLDEINVAESILKEVNRQRIVGETQGTNLKNLLDAVEYFKDALIYKKPRLLEGKIDNPVYSANLAKQFKIQSDVKKLNQRKLDIQKEVSKRFDEGDFQTDDLDKELDTVDKQLDEYAKQAHNIYGSKVADTMISINQLKALGFNPFSAVSNFSFGMVSVMIHANGKVDYGLKEAREAMGIMSNSTLKYFTFGSAQNETAQKVMALVHRTGIMGEVTDTEFGESNLPSRKKGKLRTALSPFNWQRSGDYYTKGMMMVAMMKKQKVEVTEVTSGEKKTISLWDAYDAEGKWDSKYEPNEDWYSEDVDRNEKWNIFRDKMRKVGTMVFGNQDKNAPIMARKSWLKRLVGQFRMSWFPEGIATRFIGQRYDVELGRDVKGRWTTYGDLGVFTTFSILSKQLISSLPGITVDPFLGAVDKKGNSISDLDIENMRKNFAGLAWTIAFSAMILALKAFYEDDDQGKKKTANAMQRQLLYNLLIRNYQDLMLYSSPGVIDTVSGNLIPAMSVITDARKAMVATGHYLFGDTSHEKDAFDRWVSKLSRAFPVTNLYPKTKYMLKRDLDDISSK